MPESTETDKARINLRLRKSTKELIERAAQFKGKTVSNFILSSAVSVAEKTVLDHETMQLHSQDAARFIDALTHQTPFNDAMLEALQEHEERVTKD